MRHTALPAPAGEDQLRRLAGRVFSQQLDREKPLWEIWLVDELGDGRFALICKTHHALVDGISGVDIMTVLFDLEPDPVEPGPAPAVGAAAAAGPRRAVRVLARRTAWPRRSASRARCCRGPTRREPSAGRAAAGLAAMAAAGIAGAPPSPLNVRIGPHRRFAWASADLSLFKAIKDALGGTINDVVLTVVTGALRAHLFRHGRDPEGLELKAMVPISVRADSDARRARQPGGGDVRAAAGRARGRRSSASASSTAR